MKNSIAAAVVAASLGFAAAAQAEITVGFITSQSGPGSSIGVLYDRGMKAAVEYASPRRSLSSTNRRPAMPPPSAAESTRAAG